MFYALLLIRFAKRLILKLPVPNTPQKSSDSLSLVVIDHAQ